MSSINNFTDSSFSSLQNESKLSNSFKRKFSKKRPLCAKVVLVGNSGLKFNFFFFIFLF